MSILIATILAMTALDAIWLGVVARTFYRQHLGALMAERVDWMAAGAFYLIYAGGLAFFAVAPGVESGSPLTGAIRGAAFGFVAYATYDLTNQATLRGWPWIVTLVDLTWGAVLGAAVGAIATLAVTRLSL